MSGALTPIFLYSVYASQYGRKSQDKVMSRLDRGGTSPIIDLINRSDKILHANGVLYICRPVSNHINRLIHAESHWIWRLDNFFL